MVCVWRHGGGSARAVAGHGPARRRRPSVTQGGPRCLSSEERFGVDPDRATLFVQSHVPEHAELCWILNTVTPMGELHRMIREAKRGFANAEAKVATTPAAYMAISKIHF